MSPKIRLRPLIALVTLLGTLVAAAALPGRNLAAAPAWLEPRGLNVVDLVGQIPDHYLQGLILSYDDGEGIVVYESGSRVGSRVVVNVTFYPRLTTPSWAANNKLSTFGCLGQEPHYDHMGSVVPPSVLRVYTPQGQEVTNSIHYMQITRVDRLQPNAGPKTYYRYPVDQYGPKASRPLPLHPDGLHLPANGGCRIALGGADYPRLRGVFTLEAEPPLLAYVIGVQEETFQSYIGVGGVGIFQPLMNQLRGTFGDRAGRINLDIPEGANYFLVKFPPMPGDAYTDQYIGPPYRNANRPTAGTYRLSKNIVDLSANLVFSAGFPLKRGWQDADQAPGTTYLPLMNPNQLSTHEYVLPAGIPYNSCFTQGNCPGSVLQAIHNKVMTMEIMYLSVTKPGMGGEWVPVKMAGPRWSPSRGEGAEPPVDLLQQSGQVTDTVSGGQDAPSGEHRLFLPFIARQEEETPSGCPCGWFDPLGRMMGFWP